MNNHQITSSIIERTEYFELHLDSEHHSMDLSKLIKCLNQANAMVLGINSTLNKDFMSGYDEIDIEVQALKEGSIRIPLLLKKYTAPTIIGIVTTTIGGVAVNLISGNTSPFSIQTTEGIASAESATFFENKQTKHSVGSIAKLVAEDDSISSLSITYEKSNGEAESLTIQKATLRTVADECLADEDEQTLSYPKTKLEIYGPIFENRPTSWRIKLNGQPLQAYMSDKGFLEEMTAKKIAFAPGDEIIADLEEIITEDEKGIHRKWIIRKVHSYPKYTRIIKQSPQQTLF